MRFYLSYTNRRHKSYGAGTLDGYGVHLRGWHAGARITCHEAGPDGRADSFAVAMTWGSNASAGDITLGTVYDTPDGPVWVPEKMPRNRRRLGRPSRLRLRQAARKPPRRGPNYSAEHYAERRAESRAQRDEAEMASASSHSPGWIAASSLAEHSSPAAFPAMAYVFAPDGNLEDALLTDSAEQWAELIQHLPAPGYRVLDSSDAEGEASTRPVQPLPITHLTPPALDETVFGPGPQS
jgi:hypothetical protein